MLQIPHARLKPPGRTEKRNHKYFSQAHICLAITGRLAIVNSRWIRDKNKQQLNQTTGEYMKRHLPSLAAAFLLIAVSPVEAIPVYGTFSGAVTGTGGTLVSYPVGTPVTGNYSYDFALLNGNHTSPLDSTLTFVVYIDGQGYGYSALNGSGLGFSVDANGRPVSGSAAGSWDLLISSGGLTLWTFGNNYVSAQVTYATPSVPDAGATSSLLGIALAGTAVARRFIH